MHAWFAMFPLTLVLITALNAIINVLILIVYLCVLDILSRCTSVCQIRPVKV